MEKYREGFLCDTKTLSGIIFPLHVAEYQVWLQANFINGMTTYFFFFPHQFGLHKWQLHSTSEVIEAFTNWHGLLIRAERLLGWLISQKALYLPWLCCNKHRSQPTSKNWSGKKNKFHVMLSWRSFSRKGSRMKLVWTIWFPSTVPRAYLVLSQRPTCSML